MPENLNEAVMMELNNYPIKEEAELRIYCERILFDAIYKRVNTFPGKYAKYQNKSEEEILDEIRKIIGYRGENYLGEESLVKEASKRCINVYLEELERVNKKQGLNSFYEVIDKTITYYVNKQNLRTYEEVQKMSKLIIDNYFYKNNVRVFSSSNGTRDYVSNKSKEQIYNEIQSYGIQGADILSSFSSMVADNWYQKNSNYNVENNIRLAIENVNLNSNQKAWLKSEFERGNIEALRRYVPDDLLDQYQSKMGNPSSGTFSK